MAPLSGKTVALAEGRQIEDLVKLLEQEGAICWRCPMLSIIDPPDDGPVLAWLDELRAGKFDLVVLLTGEGVRRMLACADRHQRRDEVVSAFGNVRLITRGPKPVQALRAVGLSPTLVAKVPTTEGVIQTLEAEPLQGKTVGVQLYREDNPPLLEFLARVGATARIVLPYLYAPGTDADKVIDLVHGLAEGRIDVLIFTSAPQVERLYEIARERGLEGELATGLGKTRIAAVGPIVAQTLEERGQPVAIVPEQGFQMKNLVVHIKRALTASG